MGRDNGRENYTWADVILLIDATCDLSLTAHRAIFKRGIERARFMTVGVICQGKGCVGNDFGFLRAGITDGKAIGDTVRTAHTEGNIVVTDGLLLIVHANSPVG